MRTEQAVHWNGNLLCSIDCETTGLDPLEDELIELAIVPLRPDLTVNYSIPPFDVVIQPKIPEKFKKGQIILPGTSIEEVMAIGVEAWTAVKMLEQWFENLTLPERKKITPLGANYNGFDRPFLTEWMGKYTYEAMFDYHVRDTMTLGLCYNDIANHLRLDYPFPKVGLTYMSSCLRVQNQRRHRALGDAVAAAEVYRLMVTRLAPTLMAASKLALCSPDEIGTDPLAEKGLVDTLLSSHNQDVVQPPHQSNGDAPETPGQTPQS